MDRTLPKGYELVRPLGAGGFGEVLLARQVGLDRLVAVKRLHGRLLAAPEDLERFRREAQVLASVKHPAIVRVYDFRRDDNDATLVMEYVDGSALSDLIGTLSAPAALTALADVAEGLHAASEHQVVHRDIKPDNVFVLRDGHAKLGDFGLARAVADPSVFRTTDGDIRCTPAYFAPELGQQLNEPDARSDAYAFAVMAYEVLTGRLPYDDVGGLALIAAHWTREPPPPESLVPGFPAAASKALLGALAKDPAVRTLPRALVQQLQAVPRGAWPRAPGRVGDRAAATVRAPDAAVAVPDLPTRSRRRWLLPTGVVVAALAAAGVLLTRGQIALKVGDVGLTTTPGSGDGRCPAAHFVFHATMSTNGGAGTVRLRWTRPDGVLSAETALEIVKGQRTATSALSFDVTGQRPLTGTATLHVLAPSKRDSESAAVHYSC